MFPQPHWNLNFIAFAIFPYLSLTILILGCLYRYFKNPYSWNSRSSELLDKGSLKYGSVIFHYGIILALIGHVGGLLVPQTLYNSIGFKEQYHLWLATYSGIVFGVAALIGLLMLTWRRLSKARVRTTSSLSDLLTLAILLIVIGLGTYNVTFVPYENVLHDIAPWLRASSCLPPPPNSWTGCR